MDTKGGGEASVSIECQSRHKKGHMMNIHLIHSNKEAVVNIVKDHELYDQTNEHLKDKAKEGEVYKPPQSVIEGVQDLV